MLVYRVACPSVLSWSVSDLLRITQDSLNLSIVIWVMYRNPCVDEAHILLYTQGNLACTRVWHVSHLATCESSIIFFFFPRSMWLFGLCWTLSEAIYHFVASCWVWRFTEQLSALEMTKQEREREKARENKGRLREKRGKGKGNRRNDKQKNTDEKKTVQRQRQMKRGISHFLPLWDQHGAFSVLLWVIVSPTEAKPERLFVHPPSLRCCYLHPNMKNDQTL